jgi:transcription initiation factor TFIID subunit 9B
MASQGGKDKGEPQVPPDAVAVQNLLRSMGVEDFEPRVINQLLDFTYKYITDVLLDAEAYHAQVEKNERGTVDLDDVMLAITTRAAHSFVQPPGQDTIKEIADVMNKQELPKPPAVQYGPVLPPEDDCLLAHNQQLQHSYGEQEQQQDGMDMS